MSSLWLLGGREPQREEGGPGSQQEEEATVGCQSEGSGKGLETLEMGWCGGSQRQELTWFAGRLVGG